MTSVGDLQTYQQIRPNSPKVSLDVLILSLHKSKDKDKNETNESARPSRRRKKPESNDADAELALVLDPLLLRELSRPDSEGPLDLAEDGELGFGEC